MDPLIQTLKLARQVAAFQNSCRKVRRHVVGEDQEWRLGTSYVMRNRLRDAGISNRQAAIRGMPEVSNEDGEKVMRILMALRGLENKKHLEEWESGQLKVLPKKLNLQGTVQAWRKAVKAGARWNSEVQGAREMAMGVAAELRHKNEAA